MGAVHPGALTPHHSFRRITRCALPTCWQDVLFASHFPQTWNRQAPMPYAREHAVRFLEAPDDVDRDLEEAGLWRDHTFPTKLKNKLGSDKFLWRIAAEEGQCRKTSLCAADGPGVREAHSLHARHGLLSLAMEGPKHLFEPQASDGLRDFTCCAEG